MNRDSGKRDSGIQDPGTPPALEVLRGNPTTEELAALVAVVAVLDGAGAAPALTAPTQWSRPALRAPLVPGPGAWKASALPS